MSEKAIIQFGRLDRNYRNVIQFTYEGESGKSDLTSSFLITTKTLKGANRLIIFPVSIIFQNWNGNSDPFIQIILKTDIDSYLKFPEHLIKLHPQVEDANLLVVSSIGKFKYDGDLYPFDNTLGDITVQIYLHLLINYSSDHLKEIYFDVSSGQNIYIAALLNAAYRFLPFIKFKRFLYSSKNRVEGFLLNSDPIIGKPEYPINIQKSKFSARAFNSFPFKNSQNIERMINIIFKGELYSNSLENLLRSDYFLLHGSFIFGAPLMITLADKAILQTIFEEVGLNTILVEIQNFFSKSNGFETKKVSAEDVYAFTFALAISQSIYFYFKEIIKKGEIKFDIAEKKKDDISIKHKNLDKVFNLLKEVYGQPKPDYKKELKFAVRDYQSNKDNLSNDFLTVSMLTNPGYKTNRNFDPRNFFAHGGLEKNITEVKVVDDKLTVKYNPELASQCRNSIVKYMKK